MTLTPTFRSQLFHTSAILRAPDGFEGGGEAAPADGAVDDTGIASAESLIDSATADGGAGADTVEGAAGADTTEGGEGSDTVDGGKADDAVAYDLKPPEGFEALDATALEAAAPIFRELGLDNEKAQGVVDAFAKDVLPGLLKSHSEAQAASFNESIVATRAQWAADAKADKEISPNADGFKANMALAARGRDAFATPELRELLDVTGIGNHPAVIKFFMKVGGEVSEGSFTQSDLTTPEKTEAWQRAYDPAYHPQQ